MPDSRKVRGAYRTIPTRCSECGFWGKAPRPGGPTHYPTWRGPEPLTENCPRHPDAWHIDWRTTTRHLDHGLLTPAFHHVQAEANRGGDLGTFAERFPEVDLVGVSRADLALCVTLWQRWNGVMQPEPPPLPEVARPSLY